MTRKERENYLRLVRRRDHLVERIASYDKRGNPSHTKAELSALNWALRLIENADSHGILTDLTSVTG